jgi:hypothetical protein
LGDWTRASFMEAELQMGARQEAAGHRATRRLGAALDREGHQCWAHTMGRGVSCTCVTSLSGSGAGVEVRGAGDAGASDDVDHQPCR